MARWLIGQLAVLHSPADVEIAALLPDDAVDDWTWLRWLPHVHGHVGADGAERLRIVAVLAEIVRRRLAGRHPQQRTWSGPWLVVVLDGAGDLIDLPGLSALLSDGAAVGVTAICLDRQAQRLPSSCATTGCPGDETGNRLRLHRADAADVEEVIADRVTLRWADSIARALSPLSDAGAECTAGLPDECRLLGLLDLKPDGEAVRARWRRSAGPPATIIGIGPDGPVSIDLARDGPHTLIAGSTGSGKSELLQALVGGLAVEHPPTELTFVLVDYKGGAAFADCGRLPHVTGLVTDLDGQLAARALLSLDCELRRREELLAAAGAGDLDEYRSATGGTEPLPRLVLIVDEFAALAEELPDFVAGLVAIAQRGRSLGIHLVLATQRPAGVVSPDIRANATLRIALRVSDPAESLDVIGTDAAAAIDPRRPGRAVLSIGNALTNLQVARVGGPASADHSETGVRTTPLDAWRRPLSAEPISYGGVTDLRLLVDAVCAAARGIGLGAVRRPWLRPLPRLLSASALPAGARPATVPFGLADLPTQQSQPAVTIDLDTGGSVLFTGAARSGRTSALVAVALQAATALRSSELQLHAVDCAGGGLAVLAHLPHIGTLAHGTDFEVVDALLHRVDAELAARRIGLASGLGAAPMLGGTAGRRLPRLLLLLDGWEAFVAAAEEYDGGRCVEVLLGILRTAASATATVLITGDRATLVPRLSGAVSTKYLLRLADRSDYALAGVPARAVPSDLPPGRAVRASDAAEVQIAFAGSLPTPSGQAEVAAQLATTRSESGRPEDRPPIRVRPLPHRVPLDALPPAGDRFRLGLGGDEPELVAVDLFAGSGRLLVAGPPRSGRSTALHILLAEAVASSIAVVVAAPIRSPLAAIAAERGLAVVGPDNGHVEDLAPGRCLLLVDDSEVFLDTATGDRLAALARGGPHGLAVAAAGRSDELPLTYRGVAAEVRRSRCALLLQPAPVDGELVGLRLPRRRSTSLPGRGLLVGEPAWGSRFGAAALPIQVAVP